MLTGPEGEYGGPATTVRRLREKWIVEHAEWERRSVAGREIDYAWAGGIYVKAGPDKDRAAVLVIVGGPAPFSRTFGFWG